VAGKAAGAISAADIKSQMKIGTHWLESLKRGEECWTAWQSMVDFANIAETLAEMGIGCGEAEREVIVASQKALTELHERHTERGTWAMRGSEILALEAMLEVHRQQLESTTYGWFDEAFNKTRERIYQARMGNAGKGHKVLAGQLGAAT
jgi:hypothetical protein